jgi:hypothetical protein
MKYNPLVTICIPAYNAELFIYDTLKRAINQDYANLEIIVSDDCSTDRTLQVLERFNDPRLRIIRQNRNLGNYANCNAVVRAATGDLICKVDADDLLEPNFVREMVDALLAHPQAVVAYCAMRLIDQFGQHLGYERKISGTELRIGADEYIRQVISFQGQGTCILFKRDAFEQVGGYNEKFLHTSGDWVLFREFSKIGGILYLDKVLASYRIHSLGKEKRIIHRAQAFLDHLDDVNKNWPNHVHDKEKILRKARKQWAYQCLYKGGPIAGANDLDEIISISNKLHSSFGIKFLSLLLKHNFSKYFSLVIKMKLMMRQHIKKLFYQSRQIGIDNLFL